VAARSDPAAWLAQRGFYGPLADAPRFAEAFGDWLGLIWAEGARAALRRYVAE
jgi:mannitol 2-dehydrogenase